MTPGLYTGRCGVCLHQVSTGGCTNYLCPVSVYACRVIVIQPRVTGDTWALTVPFNGTGPLVLPVT